MNSFQSLIVGTKSIFILVHNFEMMIQKNSYVAFLNLDTWRYQNYFTVK